MKMICVSAFALFFVCEMPNFVSGGYNSNVNVSSYQRAPRGRGNQMAWGHNQAYGGRGSWNRQWNRNKVTFFNELGKNTLFMPFTNRVVAKLFS